MKKSLLMLSAAIPLALAPTPGNAQSDANSNLLDRIFTLGQPKASDQDREQVNQALDSAILNPGQAVDWSSSASGNSGTVVVTRSYTNSLGYDCRNYRRTTITSQIETVHEGTVCKQLFIGWTLESEKEVSSQTLAQQPTTTAPQTTQPVTPSVSQPVVSAPPPPFSFMSDRWRRLKEAEVQTKRRSLIAPRSERWIAERSTTFIVRSDLSRMV